jgi:hypothetical protein
MFSEALKRKSLSVRWQVYALAMRLSGAFDNYRLQVDSILQLEVETAFFIVYL